jgi:hypothetical protein
VEPFPVFLEKIFQLDPFHELLVDLQFFPGRSFYRGRLGQHGLAGF